MTFEIDFNLNTQFYSKKQSWLLKRKWNILLWSIIEINYKIFFYDFSIKTDCLKENEIVFYCEESLKYIKKLYYIKKLMSYTVK